MADRLRPAAALDPRTFEQCYLGGLALADPSRRLTAGYVLLLAGRLGLRPGELLHLHEGWIDWRRGELCVPAYDPCACEGCWERARVVQRAGDGRPLGEIVAAECWSPPTGRGRTVSFGWSRRLTAVLAAGLDAWPYLDSTVPELQEVLREAARAGEVSNPGDVTLAALRAAAARFLAQAGLEPATLAALLDVDAEIATECVDRWGDGAGPGGNGDPAEALSAGETEYSLLSDPAPLDGEPFDPTDFDDEWRTARAMGRDEPPSGSPRPDAVPDDVDFDPPQGSLERTLDRDRDAGVTGGPSLSEWAERQRAGNALASTAGETTDDGVDLRERTGESARFEVSTRFACGAIHDGRPSGGNVFLSRDELVLVTHGDGENVAHELIPLHAVTDIAVDYCPESLEEVFETTVAVAYRNDGRRLVAVVELPPEEQRAVATALFARRLDGLDVVVTHPARRGGRVIDQDPEECVLSVDERELAVRPDEDGDPAFTIRLSDVIHAERGKQILDGEVYRGLYVRHLRETGEAVTTAISPTDEDERTLLERFVIRDYQRRKVRADSFDLEPAHKRVMVALYAADGSADMTAVLNMDTDRIRTVIEQLDDAGLVTTVGEALRLTGTGQMLVGDKVQDVNA